MLLRWIFSPSGRVLEKFRKEVIRRDATLHLRGFLFDLDPGSKAAFDLVALWSFFL